MKIRSMSSAREIDGRGGTKPISCLSLPIVAETIVPLFCSKEAIVAVLRSQRTEKWLDTSTTRGGEKSKE